jgi:hypothetical protein
VRKSSIMVWIGVFSVKVSRGRTSGAKEASAPSSWICQSHSRMSTNPLDVVERAGADREAAEAGGLREAQVFGEGPVEEERHHLVARPHDLLRRDGAQPQRAHHDAVDEGIAGMRMSGLA